MCSYGAELGEHTCSLPLHGPGQASTWGSGVHLDDFSAPANMALGGGAPDHHWRLPGSYASSESTTHVNKLELTTENIRLPMTIFKYRGPKPAKQGVWSTAPRDQIYSQKMTSEIHQRKQINKLLPQYRAATEN